MSPEKRQPQASQMADESMVRTLAAQTEAIWPQEKTLFERYTIPAQGRILDLGCGTGEMTSRLGSMFPQAQVTGADVIQEHLALAQNRFKQYSNLYWMCGDGYKLPFPDDTFDLSVIRHVIQAIPNALDVLKEMVRVTRSGSTLHVLAEDYGMMHFHPVTVDTDVFWKEGPVAFANATGSDLLTGRKAFTMLVDLGLRNIAVDYVVVDTHRVPREIFASIWRAWRDGYADGIAQETRFSREEVLGYFETMIDAIMSPRGFGVWQIPVVTGTKP